MFNRLLNFIGLNFIGLWEKKEKDGTQFWTSRQADTPDVVPLVKKNRPKKVRAARRLANHHRAINRR